MTLPTQPRRLSACHRHPSKLITGFCAACLTERLAGIDPATRHEIPSRSAADLRRSKSCSGSNRDPLAAGIPEPRRNSCDVRARSTLLDLFHTDNKNLGFELKEEDEDEAEEEIRVSEVLSAADADGIDLRVEKVEEFDEGLEVKTMKEHIDLEWQSKKNTGRDFKDIAGSFWDAASVFSKKLRKWKGKQKLKKKGSDLVAEKAGKPCPRRFRETQSEVGDYGLGRRSCDTDPRMSLDAGRISCDDVRFSFDEPRASWDGYLIGKAYPRLAPLVSVVEDVKVQNPVAEKMKSVNEEEQKSPGGSAQTRDYYSLQRRRRSFDRRAEVEELKSITNAEVTPETIGLFHGAKLLITEKELMESNWNQPIGGSHSSESSHSASNNDIASVAAGVVGQKGFNNKLRRWHKVWNIWGSIQKQRQGENKCEAEEKYLGGNVIDRPLADSWQKLRRVANGEGNGAVSQKLMRSYSVSSRNSYSSVAGLVHSIETKGNINKRREELVLQRNRNTPYSPTNLDNGLLRFYLTPLRTSRSKSGKSRLKTSHSISRNVL